MDLLVAWWLVVGWLVGRCISLCVCCGAGFLLSNENVRLHSQIFAFSFPGLEWSVTACLAFMLNNVVTMSLNVYFNLIKPKHNFRHKEKVCFQHCYRYLHAFAKPSWLWLKFEAVGRFIGVY